MTNTNLTARFFTTAILLFGLIASAFSQTTSVVKTFNTPGDNGIVFGAGVSTANVSLWGGGGGGSAGGMKQFTNCCDYILHYGSGGGGANWAGKSFTVIPFAFYPFTVGSGGAAGGFDGNNNPASGLNGTDSYFNNGAVVSFGAKGATNVGYNSYGGARGLNSVPDPGPPYAADGEGERENQTFGGDGGLSNNGPYGPSGVNVNGYSGLGSGQILGTRDGGPGTRPGDGGGGGGMSVFPFPLAGVLAERYPGGRGANGSVSFYVTYPTYRLTSNPVVTKLCGPGSPIVTLTSTALYPGIYTVTYTTTNPATTNTVGMNWNAAGFGTFTTIPLSNTSVITITNLASGNTCSDAITQFNTVTAVVENITANSWKSLLDFSGTGRSNGVSFNIGNKAYVGTGKNGATLLNDFWQFDPATNAWTQLANFGGGVRTDAVGLAIGTKGYIGTGSDGTNNKNDYWEYDPFTNLWTAKASFPGSARYGATGFTHNYYGYIGTGYNGSAYFTDFWQYDPRTNTWVAKASFGGAGRSFASGFAIGSKGYITLGTNGSTQYNDVWEYYPEFNTWQGRTAFPGAARSGAIAFTIGYKGYVGTGWNGTASLNDFYEFDPYANSWATKASFTGTARRNAVGFAIADKGYVGLGLSGGTYNKDMFEYSLVNTKLTTGSISGTSFCIGSSFTIPFSMGCITPGPGNIFSAELSDSLGSFSSGIWPLGSTAATGINSITATIPSFVPTGSKYRVRVSASNPVTIGNDNGFDIAIKPTFTGTITAGISNTSICRGEAINLTAAVTVPATSDTSVILSENFNTGAAAWQMTNSSSYTNFNPLIYTNGQNGYHSNDNSSFYLTSSTASPSTGVTNTILQSPVFSTLGMNAGSLSFWHHYQYGNYNNSDSIRVQISTNNGANWTTIYLNNTVSVGDPQDSLGFKNQTTSLDNYMNQPNVVLRFCYGARGGVGKWMIDNIVIKGIKKANNFIWTSNPAGFSSSLQNPTAVIPTFIPGTTSYTVTFANNFGCGSSTSTVSVLVKDTSSSTTMLSICPSQLPYTWNGLIFNTAGTQIKHLPNSAGCDSAAKLILTVRPVSSSSTTISICPPELPYSWNGLTFNSSGSQTAHFLNSVGCDSAATLNLIVKPVSTYTTNLSICETALPYSWNGLTFNTAGSQTAHFTNSVGCDSAATLNLTTLPSIVTATANLTYVCPGASINLQATSASGGAVTLLNEKFNSTHNNWTKVNLSSGGIPENAAWTLRPNSYSILTGISLNSNDNSQFMLSSAFSQGTPTTTNTTLQSPTFSTVGLSTASLSFYHQFAHQPQFANDSVRVQVSADGTNWTNVYFNSTTSVGSQSQFILQTISLNSYLNQPALRLRFNYNGSPLIGGYSNIYWAVDNVLVTGTLAANSYSWTSVPAGFTSALQNPATFNPTQTATYNVAVNNGFCSRTGSVAIVVNTSNPSSTNNLAICAASLPFSWNGLTFNAAGTQTAHIITAGGCDSAATLNLTIKPTSSSITNITICPSGLPYTWNGLIFNASGTQVKHLTNSVGCDSAATLNLTVQTSSTSSVTTITICATQLPYVWNGLTFNASGRQIKTLTNSFGCDSAATLNLIVSDKPGTVTAATSASTVCAGTAFNLTSSSIAPTILLNENFNGATNNWIKQNLSTGGNFNAAAWTLRPAGYLFLGAILVQSNDASQFYLSDSYTQGAGGTTSTYLQSPAFNTMGYSAASLTFYQVYPDKDANDFGRVQVSIDNGATWTQILNQTTFLGQYSNFALQTVSLNAYVNNPSVMIRFNYVGVNATFWGIDNVKVTGTPVSPAYSWSSVPAGFNSSLQNPTGVTATQSTIYKVIASNTNGCSDSSTVAVTIKPLSTSNNSLTICPSSLPYSWNGLTFSGAGSQTAHLPNSVGCDSAATLNLTVKAASTSINTVSICPSALPYSWNGLTFNAAGTQTAHFSNSIGCDSAASLTLTLKAVSTSITNTTICESALPYTWNGLTFNAAGTQTAHFENSVGCDSAASLVLTVNPSPTNLTVTASSVSVCERGSVNLFASSTTPAGGANIVLLSEDFNSATNNWTKVNQSTGGTPAAAAWTLRPDGYGTAGVSPMHSNDNSQFYLSNSDAQGAGSHTNTTLQSPVFSTVGYSTASLTFNQFYQNSDPNYDFIKVQVSTDGTTWTNVYVSSSNVIGANSGFVLQTVSLDGYLNKPGLRLRFNYDCFWGFRWGIDNIKVTGTPLNTYSWTSSPAGFTSSLQNPTGIIPNLTTEYTVSVGTSNGCIVTNSILVAVGAGPSATIAYEASPCTSADTLGVTQTGTTGGLYSAATGLAINALTGTVTLSGSTAGIYTVTYTVAASGSCPLYTTTASVTVARKYTITASASPNGTIASPGATIVCEGTNITYNINPSACASISDVLINGTSVGAVSTYTFTNVAANNSISAVFSPAVPQPVIACYQTATFNSATCQWVISGTQPVQPATACYQAATFNNTTCSWDISGTQPTQPTAVNCWDNYQFNTTTCTWVNNGTQPIQPTAVNCWDHYEFSSGSCAWVNIGTQPPAPPRTNCWDNYQFNPATCTWVNNGTQPTQPTTVNCWDHYEFSSGSCAWINIGTQPPAPPRSNCWDNYQFNPATCTWVNNGTQPTQPTTVNCWDHYEFSSGSCAWVNIGVQPPAPPRSNCWDNYQFNQASCTWVNMGIQPAPPTPLHCWDNYQFSTGSCSWVNIGVQPPAPPRNNCWDNYQFNAASCTWVNTGTQPAPPTAVNCWDNYQFSTGTCAWVNIGTQPPAPPRNNCWDNYQFNAVSCTWVNMGTQPAPPTAVNCWDNYQFNTTSCSWVNAGTQPTQPTAVNCWDNYQFNTGSCLWVNIGTQPIAPQPVNCWDDYHFNTTSCSWVNAGTQPTQPTAVNCWDNYQFNTGSCLWVNIGTQPIAPQPVNCWDNYQFNTTSCSWVNAGTQPTQPTAVNCWDNYQFSPGSCLWVNIGTQPIAPQPVNCWDNYQFNTTTCTWVNEGSQAAAPTISPAGSLNICPGGGIILTSSAAANNQWYFNGNILNGATGTTINAVATGSYTVRTIANNCPSVLSALVNVSTTSYLITVAATSNGTITPGTNSVVCGDDATYTITAAAGYVIADVLVDGLSQGAVGTYSFINVSANHTISAGFIADNVSFTITSGAGTGGSISPNPITTVATGGNQTYSITANACFTIADVLVDGVSVGAVSSYIFTSVTANHTITASFIQNGPYTITASAGSNGSITAAGSSTVNCGTDQTYNITPASCYSIADVLVDGVSAGAVATYSFINTHSDHTISASFIANASLSIPVVTGPVNVCPYIGTGDQVTYTVSSIGASSYSWTLPPNVSVVSGAGTAALTVTFSAGFASQPNKQLKVTGLSSCGNSIQTIYYLLAQTAGTPAPISGNTNICGIIGTSATYTYTIPVVTGASSYVWTAQAGTTLITNNGTSATISFGSNFTTSTVTVRAVNDCGISNARSITVVRSNPSTPGPITGPTNACAYTAPNGTTAAYSILPVAGATSYNWTVPGGVAVTGQGTTSISFMYPATFTSGTVTVTATNGCGTSETRSLAIGKTIPGTPGVIDVIQLQTCPDRIYSYTLAAMPYNAASVLWTVPAGATILSGAGTSGITVSYPSTAVVGTVTAQSISNCGNGNTRSTAVRLPLCATEFARGKSVAPAPAPAVMKVNVYPNPSVSNFNVKVITAEKEIIHVRILDVQGRAYKQFSVLPYQTTAVGADLKAGAYLLEVQQGAVIKVMKLVKF